MDAVAAVILDGLSYRRAGCMVGISKTEVGDSMDLLLGPLAAPRVLPARRHVHHHPRLAISTIHGDLLWCDGGWPGTCHEQELIALSGIGGVLDASGVATILDRGFRGMAKPREHWHAPLGTGAPRTG